MDSRFKRTLAEAVGAQNVRTDEPMSLHTTFRVGGPADYLVTPDSAEAVRRAAGLCRERGVALYVMGCGSNLLVADAGLRGVVMKIGPKYSDVKVRGDGTLTAQAGAVNAKVARAALDAGLSGLEFAAGIPGSIGGAAVMNAGAYGGQLADVATGVTCLSPDGGIVELSAADAGWGYRSSRMAGDGSIVLGVSMRLEPGDPAAIRDRMVELARRRSEKQPLDLPSAGSTFKRPPGHYAGKLIQDAGMQGHAVGGAQVSAKHAGFIVNAGGATASDILKVMEDVQAAVRDRFGVELEPEVRIWR